jgi:hypothetical protein
MKVLPDFPFIALVRHKVGILPMVDFQIMMSVYGAMPLIGKSRF